MKKIIMALAVLTFCGVAQAQFMISPSIAHISEQNDAVGSSPSTAELDIGRTFIDARFAYIFPMGFVVGATYSSLSFKFGSNSGSGMLVGPTVGYYHPMGFHFLFTYHLMGEAEQPLLTSTDKYTGGSGMQVDFGWAFPLGANFSIGPNISYRSIEFSKYSTGVVPEVDSSYKMTQILPHLALFLMF